MGLVVIEVEAQDVDVFVAGVSREVLFFAAYEAVGRIADGEVVDAFVVHEIVYGVSEELFELFVGHEALAPPEPVAVAFVEGAEDHGDLFAFYVDAD